MNNSTKLLDRVCPFCSATDPEIILNLQVNDFAPLNPTYDLKKIDVMGLAKDQKFPIVKCRRCDFVYAYHILNDELLHYVYSTVISVDKAQEYRSQTVKRWSKMPLLHLLFSLASKQSGGEISFLDFGCGWGETLQIGRACGVECCGVEIEQQRIKFLRDQGFVVKETIDDLINSDPFDIVYSNVVLEHVPNPRQILEGLASVTKSGGYGFFGVPAYTERRMKRICRNFSRGQDLPDKNINPWEHLNYFSPANFREMLEQCGFKVIAPVGMLPYAAFPLSWSDSLALFRNTLKELGLGLLWYRARRNRLIVQRV
jgi:SAM-dependent methyltransferase